MSNNAYIHGSKGQQKTRGVYRPVLWDINQSFDDAFAAVDYDDTRESASSIFNQFGKGWDTETEQAKRYSKALAELARTVAVVRPTLGKKAKGEMSLKVRWADGSTFNTSDSDTVVVSPDILNDGHTAKPKWSATQLNDAAIGDALLGAGMARFVGIEARIKIVSTSGPTGALAERIWHVAETDRTRREVCKTYPGFLPYFKATIQYHTNEKYKGELEAKVNGGGTSGGNTPGMGAILSSKPTAATCAELFAWNTLHPDDRIPATPDYAKGIEFLNGWHLRMAGDADSTARAMSAITAADKLRKMFPEDKDKDKNKDKNKDNGGGDNGPSRSSTTGEDSGDGTSPSTIGTAATPSETGRDDGDIAKALAGQVEDTANPSSGHTIPTMEKIGGPVLVFRDNQRAKRCAEYNATVRPLITEFVPVIKNYLRFRSSAPGGPEAGFRSGGLDEDSLFKLAIDRNDDRLFCRPMARAVPSVSVSLMLDESGSMTNGNRFMDTRIFAACIAEALHGIAGVSVDIYGWASSNVRCYQSAAMGHATPEYLTLTEAGGGTYEAASIGVVLDTIRKLHGRVEKKLVIVLSDGNGGGGASQVKDVCEACAHEGVMVLGLGIAKAYGKEWGDITYGPGRWLSVGSPKEAIAPIGAFLGQFCMAK